MKTKYCLLGLILILFFISPIIADAIEEPFDKNSPVNKHPYREDEVKYLKPIENSKESILKLSQEVETIHSELHRYDNGMKNSIRIDRLEESGKMIENGKTIYVDKYLNLIFENGKMSRIMVNTRKKYFEPVAGYSNYILTFFPEKPETSIILAENKSSVREVKFGEISESAKLEILRYVEKNLKETVYKLEIQLHKFKKKRRNEERIQAEILQ